MKTKTYWSKFAWAASQINKKAENIALQGSKPIPIIDFRIVSLAGKDCAEFKVGPFWCPEDSIIIQH